MYYAIDTNVFFTSVFENTYLSFPSCNWLVIIGVRVMSVTGYYREGGFSTKGGQGVMTIPEYDTTGCIPIIGYRGV